MSARLTRRELRALSEAATFRLLGDWDEDDIDAEALQSAYEKVDGRASRGRRPAREAEPMSDDDIRTLVADDGVPEGIDDPTGRPATAEQIEASDRAVHGLIYIDGRDGRVCAADSFAYAEAERADALVKVWVD